MKKLAFFDTKPYDKEWFDKYNKDYEITYFESKLTARSVKLAEGFDAVCAFVNDQINEYVIDKLCEYGIGIIAMRCAGYNNIDMKYAKDKIKVVRVPAYSPYAVAEHAMAMLQTLNRHLHKAYNRTRDFNFSIVGLTGTDLHGKTAGVIGTGKIGRVFIDICRGFGINVLAYDPYPIPDSDINYTDLDTLLRESDIISLHCPLTDETYYTLDKRAFRLMTKKPYIINTSRGGLIDSSALLDALNSETIRGAVLDVYEEETELFYEDNSDKIIHDDVLSLLVSRPNVIITSHQAFLTEEALAAISETTLGNLNEYFSKKENGDNEKLTNEV
ncbi:MAG: 2-hydroxyacid dehydrogenase [Clostridia bacterium]|nr:2-hydroxyacid dehydrogenase [Clostridia bacterium]